ncbi:PKD domain-containing protein [Algoriphagus yeomjeoni]|uniref:PKD domain-containing protein n=1 Tax=Algoriphagus yeomjeoni TaxID=291403 RepID=UPI003CE4DD31
MLKQAFVVLIQFTLLAFITSPFAHSQNLPSTKEVNHYFVGFMDNLQVGDPLEPTLVITALEEDVEGVIEFRGNSVPFTLGLGEIFEFEANNNLVVQTNRVIEDKGIHIYSEGEVSVYALGLKPGTFDGSLVLPLDQLGSNYFIASHYENQTEGIGLSQRQFNNESQVLVVGTKDNTQIQVVPTSPINNSIDPFTVTLNAGETYQFKSKGDLTGTEISVINSTEQCSLIAVFSGNKYADIGDPVCGPFSTSHIFNQNEPVSSWGTEFFHVPLKDRELGELVKFIAAFDNTEIFNGTDLIATIDAGEFYTLDVQNNLALHFTSTKPIGVFGFGKSYSCEILDENSVLAPANVANYGNPQMVNYAPFDVPKTQLTVNFQKVYGTLTHFAQLVTRSSDVGQMQVDGVSVANQFSPVANNPDYSFARIPLLAGVHTLSNPAGFSGYFYAVGPSQSYAVDFGIDFENNDYEILSSFDDLTTGSPRIACIDQEGTWSVDVSDPSYSYFLWDFGDESPKKPGQEVTHTYTEPGIYLVKVFASLDDSGCEETELHEFEVEVVEIDGELTGPTTACPNVEELTYLFEGEGEISEVLWQATGGEIISQTNEEVVVRWGATNPNAILQATPVGTNGCVGIPIELNVVIKQELEPELPLGPVFICDLVMDYTYTVPEINSLRSYEWEIIGGVFTGGNMGPQVDVRWDETESEGILFYREFSILDEFCEGISPELIVALNTGFQANVSTQSNVSCFGAEDGEIILEIEGGIAPYTYSWSHDQNLNSAIASDLPPGTYTATIQDSQGCKILLENLEISEPEALEITTVEQTNPSCFGNTDGSISFEIQGGTPPYRSFNPEYTVNQNLLTLDNLEGGNYLFQIIDAENCEVEISIALTDPDPLEVELTVVSNPCLGNSNGSILAELPGGSGPYSYEWSDGSTNQLNEGLPSGEYEVRVKDAQGCVAVGSIRLLEVAPKFRFPTGFNSEQGEFGPISNCGELQFTLSIFNRWGQLIYVGNTPWDGSFNSKDSPTGTYSYRFDYEFLLNDELVKDAQVGSVLKIN